MAYTKTAINTTIRDEVTSIDENGACWKTVSGKKTPVLVSGVQLHIEMVNATTPLKVFPDNTVCTPEANGTILARVGNTAAGALQSPGNVVYTGWSYRRIAYPTGINGNRVRRNSFTIFDRKYKKYIVDYTIPAVKALFRRKLGRG